MSKPLELLFALIHKNNGINDKDRLAKLVSDTFGLTKDRCVYYCPDYAIRFSSSATRNFNNTVLSLSNLRKYDNRPFIVCLVTPTQNFCLIANTTFLKKISHSSQKLRENNIRGSFNGSDIMQDFKDIENTSDNIPQLFAIHAEIGFEGNLPRLVEATNNISPSGSKFHVDEVALENILKAPERAIQFIASRDAEDLKAELDEKVAQYKNEILCAALIKNVNVRGRVIQYLIAGNNDGLRQHIIKELKSGQNGLPIFKTDNALGDYQKKFDNFDTKIDIKTKLMSLNSNPKAYNLDKMLELLAHKQSVFMLYFVGINQSQIINTVLVSMFQKDLLQKTILLQHWAGRNSRGVSQFEGKTVNKLIHYPSADIDEIKANKFLEHVIEL